MEFIKTLAISIFLLVSCVYNLLFSCHIACPDLSSGESRLVDNHPSVCRLRHACLWQTGSISYVGYQIIENLNLTVFSDQNPTDTPLVFGKGIISTENKEFAITFSPEMDELYFTRRKPEEKNKIYTLKFIDEKWSEPELTFFPTDKGWDFEPHINPKGDRLYFGSTRPLTDDIQSSGMHQWYSEKNENGWGEPLLENRVINRPKYPNDRKQPFPALYFPENSAKESLFSSWIFFLEAEKKGN